MFCFHCGDQLVEHRGELYCHRGNMGLSKLMRRTLEALVAEESQLPVEANTSRQSKKYCPRCAQSLYDKDQPGLIKLCIACGLKLPTNVMYQMVELHPHGYPVR